MRAWNAQFERIIWREILTPRYGFPEPELEPGVGSAAEAAARARPRNLPGAAQATGVAQQKDKDGYALMMRMTRPRKVVDDRPVWWDKDTDKLTRLYAYCKQDVRTERAIIKCLRRLSPREREVYLLDQRINDRGFKVDRPLILAARAVVEEGVSRANETLASLTEGVVTSVTENGRLTGWLRAQGVETPGVAKAAVREMLESDLDPSVREVLQTRADAGRSSTAKLVSMLDHADEADDRVRGSLLYHGASTGRWTGRGVQPQNFPRGEFSPEQLAEFLPDLRAQRYDHIDLLAHPITVVSSALRSMIIADEGHDLIVADYSAIEARVLNWLAGQQDVVSLFAQGADVYSYTAAKLTNTPYVPGQKHAHRQTGKFAELGCGYGMGAENAVRAAKAVYQLELTPERAKEIVTGYRSSHRQVVQLWYAAERACLRALDAPGEVQRFGAEGNLRAIVAGAYLYLVLPSGRPLCYAAPRAVVVMTPWGEEKLQLEFSGVDPLSKGWGRLGAYGGLLVENIVQAVSRDIMAEGMLRVEAAGYPCVLSVHDEVVAEPEQGGGSVEEFVSLLSAAPEWAKGCPITAEGWRGPRYRK